MSAVVTLDCRGKPCPLPIIELGRSLPSVAVGDLIAVAADGVPVYVVRRLS